MSKTTRSVGKRTPPPPPPITTTTPPLPHVQEAGSLLVDVKPIHVEEVFGSAKMGSAADKGDTLMNVQVGEKERGLGRLVGVDGW